VFVGSRSLGFLVELLCDRVIRRGPGSYTLIHHRCKRRHRPAWWGEIE
jgi:hypothetical protein